MKRSCWRLVCISLAVGLLGADTRAEQAIVSVGPNILVSRDGDGPHIELIIAANPTNRNNLVGAAMTLTGPSGGLACKTYVSTDGGYTWAHTSFPEQLELGGFDPQVAFGPSGTAYFAVLAAASYTNGQVRDGLYVYRSEDGGKNWQRPAYLGRADHPQIVVDQTAGKYRGRVYLNVLMLKNNRPTVSVFHSDDTGRTFSGPVDIAAGEELRGVNATGLAVLSDGTLIASFVDFANPRERRRAVPNSTLWCVASSDGGVSFSAPMQMNVQHRRVEHLDSPLYFDVSLTPSIAADIYSAEFRDRLYVSWTDHRFGRSRILFSYSRDRGKTWTEPKQISPEVSAADYQYQPAMVVNNQGILGIQWFDTRWSRGDQGYYDVCFTASFDGGESFLPVARVSSESSASMGSGNLSLFPLLNQRGQDNLIHLRLASTLTTRPSGGDYVGLTADTGGVFHSFWPDSRSGTWQAWTSHVIVVRPEGRTTAAGSDSSLRIKMSLTDHVEVVFDPGRYDAATQEAVIKVRLRNVSHETLFGPFTVEVKSMDVPDPRRDLEPLKSRRILNAANGKTGSGAVFDYAAALRDCEALEPGAMTEAVDWRMRFSGPSRTSVAMAVEVTGYLSRQK